MLKISTLRWRLIAVLFPLVLAACSEIQFAAQTAKDLQPTSATGEIGRYKVGEPYQVGGVWYYPKVDYAYDETGIASWYGPGFHGKLTANGETYDQNDLTAAHRTLPLPSLVQVTNLDNGRSIELRLNDRGPFKNGRIIDVSRRAAQLLGFEGQGTAKVRVRILEQESRQLAALAQGGAPAAGEERAPAPPAVPVETVSVEALPGGNAPEPIARPLGAETQLAANRTPVDAPAPDGSVTLEPILPTDIYVQAGAFTQILNAKQLAARLSSLGQVRIETADVGGTQFFRVQIGPVNDVNAADTLLTRLLDNGFTDSRVVVQ
jgi:rare lipoprotein A